MTHHRKRTTQTKDAFHGRNFILKNNLNNINNYTKSMIISNNNNSTRSREDAADNDSGQQEEGTIISNIHSGQESSSGTRLNTLIVPAASPSSPEIVFNVAASKMTEKKCSISTTQFPMTIKLVDPPEFNFVTPKSRQEMITTISGGGCGGGNSSTIGEITPSLFDAIYSDLTPESSSSLRNFSSNKKSSESGVINPISENNSFPQQQQTSSSPELSIGSLPSDILSSSPEYVGFSPPLFASSHNTVSKQLSDSSPSSPKKKKMKPNEKMVNDVDNFNLVSQESGCEKGCPLAAVGNNFDIQSNSRVFALEFKLNDLSCEIEEIVCIELLKNGNDFQETGIRFHTLIIQKADDHMEGKYYLTDALTNLSRLIYSNSFYNVNDHCPKIVTRSHGKKMEMLLDTLQNIVVSDTFNSYSFLNNLHQLISDQTIYLYESFKENIKLLCNEQEILNHLSISTASNWMCQTCSVKSSLVCSLVECTITSLLFQRMYPIIQETKKKSSQSQLEQLQQQQLDDSAVSLNIDYEEVANAIKTPPPMVDTPKKKTSPENRSLKKISKIKISPRGIVSVCHSSREFKKTLQLGSVRTSPKKTRTLSSSTSSFSIMEKENEQVFEANKPIIVTEHQKAIQQFVPPPRTTTNVSTSPNVVASSSSSSSAKLTILKKRTTVVEWTDQTVEELLLQKSVPILHFFGSCKQKNLDSFFKSKSSMIIQMRPFLSVRDLVKKFSEHPCLGLINLVQFCKTTFGL